MIKIKEFNKRHLFKTARQILEDEGIEITKEIEDVVDNEKVKDFGLFFNFESGHKIEVKIIQGKTTIEEL